MVDFRKSLLLAAMALAVGVGTASAQAVAPACIGTNGAVPDLRSEGQAELTGGIVLTCSNISSATVNFDVFLNSGTVPITSRAGEALVTVSYVSGDGPTVSYPATFVSTNGAFLNDARFSGIAIAAADPQISITGIRADVNPTYVPINTGGFGQVLATISVSNGILPITQVNGGFFVGIVLPGLGTVTVPSTGFSVQSCEGGVPIPANTAFTVDIPENFATAFKVLGPNGADSETGPAPGALIANSATQFEVVFGNIPSGVTFYIPETITSTGGGVAVLVAGEGSAVPATGLVLGSDAGFTDPTLAAEYFLPVPAGVAFFYNVVVANSSVQETYTLPVYPIGTVSATTGTPTVSVVLAPQAADLPVNVPRFISLTSGNSNLPVISVTPCQTTLMFPYMTNEAGFDTGFSIAATSADPFGTFAQGGTCTLYMYGANPPATTPVLTIPTAGEGHATVSSVAPNFQGYVIAICDFLYAHGYAFLSNGFSGIGNGALSEGYLALEVGNTRINTPSTSVNGVGGGEGLLH